MWGFVLTATLGATAFEVSRAGGDALGVAVLVSALVFGGPWHWVRRWLGRAALGWGSAMGVHGLSRWLSTVPVPSWHWSPAQF